MNISELKTKYSVLLSSELRNIQGYYKRITCMWGAQCILVMLRK